MAEIKNVSKVLEKITNVNKPDDLSMYGREFQVKFLALLIKDRVFSFTILPIVKHEYFTDAYLKKIFLTIKKYIEAHNECPTFDNIKILLTLADEKIALFEKLLNTIETVSLADRTFVIDNARKFCFSRHALAAQEEVRKCLEEGDFEKAKALSTESFKYSGLDTALTYDLKRDYEMVFDEENEHNPIPTPFPTFNANMKGGPGKGNLVIMVAESNFGKSNALIAFSRHANSVGKNVVFFSFEIGGSDMLRRHIAGLNGLKQEEVKHSRKQIEARFADDNLGEFILIQEKATNARISTIKNHLEYLKSTGFFPDMICVDALNQLKLPVGMRYEGDNQKFEYLAEELRDLSMDYQLPVVTVMQTNRSGFSAEVNDIQAIGKAIEPFQVADVLLTFGQTKAMAAENKCTCLLLKNRLGKKFICLEVYYDPNMCVFDEIAVVNEMLLLSDSAKNNIKNTAGNIRAKVMNGDFDKKN